MRRWALVLPFAVAAITFPLMGNGEREGIGTGDRNDMFSTSNNKTGRKEIWVMDYDGEGVKRLTLRKQGPGAVTAEHPEQAARARARFRVRRDPVLAASRLTRAFGGYTAVAGLDLSVERGAIHAVIGPNGAGKTTLFNLVTGVLPPTAGRLHFEGEDITGWRANRITARGVARTFQNIRLFRDMTAIENVLVGAGKLQAELAVQPFEGLAGAPELCLGQGEVKLGGLDCLAGDVTLRLEPRLALQIALRLVVTCLGVANRRLCSSAGVGLRGDLEPLTLLESGPIRRLGRHNRGVRERRLHIQFALDLVYPVTSLTEGRLAGGLPLRDLDVEPPYRAFCAA